MHHRKDEPDLFVAVSDFRQHAVDFVFFRMVRVQDPLDLLVGNDTVYGFFEMLVEYTAVENNGKLSTISNVPARDLFLPEQGLTISSAFFFLSIISSVTFMVFPFGIECFRRDFSSELLQF